MLVGLANLSLAHALHAQEITPKTADPGPAAPAIPVANLGEPLAPTKFNPTGRDISLSSPLRDGDFVLGEVQFVLTADDRINVETKSFIDALRPVLSPERITSLQATFGSLAFIPTEQLAPLGIKVRYDPETIGLVIAIPADARAARNLSILRSRELNAGDFTAPARISGYINFRNFADYTWSGSSKGFDGPSSLIDSAIRVGGVVLENEARLDFGSSRQKTFVREGTRLVYDDRNRLIRFSAGDEIPIGRGFVGSAQVFGVGAQRIYSIIDPLRQVQPRGDRSFTLTRPSTVETLINGRQVRQIRLDPGTYNVSDFPFVQGSNDIQFRIQDDGGSTQTLSFSQYYDRTLLANGLTEFAVYAGVFAPFNSSGRDYQFDEPAASGWFRRGISDVWTAGANFNIRKNGGAAGFESVLATAFGTLGTDLAVSTNKGLGTGFAGNVTIQKTFGGYESRARSLSASAEYRSPKFSTPGAFFVDNRFSWSLSASYSQSVGDRQFVSLTGNYQIARGVLDNEYSARATYGYTINSRLSLTVDGTYEQRNLFGREYGVRASLLVRLGRRSSAIAEIDTRSERARIGYQTSSGEGVGSFTASADLDVGRNDVGGSGGITYQANRAELGINHNTLYSFNGQSIDSQRTSLRVGTALVFADGKLGLSRPIFDSFAMVAPHNSLNGADVYIDPREQYYNAKSGTFGPAIDPDLSAYIPRTLTYDVPNAPTGYDLGASSVRVLPPYRGGYLVIAGSAYSVTAVGSLLDPNGQAVSLLAGRATEVGVSNAQSVTIFTNRTGRFGMTGLRAGKWRIDMPTEPPTSVVIDIPEGELGVVRLGTVKLGDAK